MKCSAAATKTSTDITQKRSQITVQMKNWGNLKKILCIKIINKSIFKKSLSSILIQGQVVHISMKNKYYLFYLQNNYIWTVKFKFTYIYIIYNVEYFHFIYFFLIFKCEILKAVCVNIHLVKHCHMQLHIGAPQDKCVKRCQVI